MQGREIIGYDQPHYLTLDLASTEELLKPTLIEVVVLS